MPPDLPQTALIAGAGSGVGEATALALASRGWKLALIGRTRDSLDRVAHLCRDAGAASATALVCDIAESAAVDAMAVQAEAVLGPVGLVIDSAGTNVRRRHFADTDAAAYRQVMAANADGAFYLANAFIPRMRNRGGGTLAFVISDAGKRTHASAGVGYSMSKFAMAGLSEVINAEERRNGIRAIAVYPGEINTPLLDKRPSPPPAERRTAMLQPEDVAACIVQAVTLPPRAIVEELVVRPAAD